MLTLTRSLWSLEFTGATRRKISVILDISSINFYPNSLNRLTISIAAIAVS